MHMAPGDYHATDDDDAFPVAGPKTWNALPQYVTSSQSEYTFHSQLKTCFSRSLFRTYTDCILTFSLGLSVPTLRRFCHLRSTMMMMMMMMMMMLIVCRRRDIEVWLRLLVRWSQLSNAEGPRPAGDDAGNTTTGRPKITAAVAY